MDVYGTGNERVDHVSRINITGNVIPMVWYKTIKKPSGKPNLNAIVILADVVYWYRASEIRDEGTGRVTGYRKKFKSDLLQRSYQQIADQFGITKRDATNAVVELEKLGVLRRVFRTIESNGVRTSNVLFLDLDPDALERLTFPEGDGDGEKPDGDSGTEGEPKADDISTINQKKVVDNSMPNELKAHLPPKREGAVTQISERVPPKSGTPPTQISQTNTETTTETSYGDYPIQSIQRMEDGFKKQIEYDALVERLATGDRERLDEMVRIAVDVLSSETKTIRVNCEDKPRQVVQSQFRKLDMTHVQYVLESLERTGKRVVNVRAVLITAMYNAANTIMNYYDNRVRMDMKGGCDYQIL